MNRPPNTLKSQSLLVIAIRPSSPTLFIRSKEQRLRLGRRCKLTLRPNPRPIPPKDDGYRHKDERDAAEERASPVNA